MEDDRNRVLVGECISRASIEGARGATLEQIDRAIEACDYDLAATLAFARARVGEHLPTDTVARVLPGIELPAIVMALVAITSDRASLLEIVQRRRFPQGRDAAELEAIVLFAAWRAGADITRVIPELRRLSARPMSAEGYALLATIAATTDDPNVAVATKPIAPFAKEHAKQVAADEKAMTASIDAMIASLPAEVEVSRAGGFTVRAAKQVGRNDLCPCGSGLKYKKCCADKPQVAPSPIPALSWDEFLRSDQIAIEHVEEMPLRELARIDLSRLQERPLVEVFRRFVSAHEWPRAELVIDEAAHRDATVAAEVGTDHAGERVRALAPELRDELVFSLLECGERTRAREHIARLPADLAEAHALSLAIDDGPAAAWAALVLAARDAVANKDKEGDLELAYTLLRAEPALGIVAARACIGTMHADDAELLLDLVEDARDRLNVAPNDPAWDVLDALTDKGKQQKIDEEARLRASLKESSERVDELERTLAAMRVELESARTRPAAELMRAPQERDRTSTLDAKVRELEALIREGNAERRELRRQLDHASPDDTAGRREGPRARRATLVETDDDVGDDIEPGARGVVIPRFDRRALDALTSVPATVAAEAMRTIGTLAAGDGFSWRSVKQAKDMARPVLMARVGIHHRLLFRSDDGALDVLDVITREQLQTVLKRLRAAR